MSNNLIVINNLLKTYDGKRYILKNMDFKLSLGELVIICGESGCGKSTFLNIIGLLDSFSDGEFIFDGEELNKKKINKYHQIRADKIGFIFQAYHLIESLSVVENILLPFLYSKEKIKIETLQYLDVLLDKFNLNKIKDNKASTLSGGEKQRVAIVRAIIKNPKLIIADEPTGNLDPENSKIIIRAFKELVNEGCSIIVVTHNRELFDEIGKIYYLKDGRLIS